MLALGIPFAAIPHEVRSNRGTTYTFFFEDSDASGQFKFRDMLAAWNQGEEFIDNNPEHPMSYIMGAFENRNVLLDRIKDFKQFVMMESNGKIKLINADAAEDDVKELLSY